MGYIRFILLFCLFGCGALFAQTVAPKISSSNCEKPEYPSASKRLTEEGTVQLKFLVGLDGKVIESAVEKSSGFRRLDEAARQSLSKCTFSPGSKNGVATESWASMKYTWRLDGFAQCLGSDVSKWNRCLGTLTTSTGGLSVIEYENGKKSGRGIEYDKSGDVIRAGIFEGENLVSVRNLDPQLYPFRTQLTANTGNQSVNTVAVQPNISTSNLPICKGIDLSIWSSCFGIFTYSNGVKYIGEFKNGKHNGQGTFIHADGSKYIGEFKDGFYNGEGYETFSKGDSYLGEYKDNMRNGQGVYIFANGNAHLGEWRNNKPHGRMVEYLSDKSISRAGIYESGKFIRDENINPSIFTRIAKNPALQQVGSISQIVVASDAQTNISTSNLPACQGSYKNKWNLCIGIEDYDSGVIRKFVGVYLNGERNGEGIEYAKDGSVLRSGTWKGFYNLVNSRAIDIQKFPFNSSALASIFPTSATDSAKAERDQLALELEASRKKQEEREQQLRLAAQAQQKEQIRVAQEVKKKDQERQLAEQREKEEQRILDEVRTNERLRLSLQASEISRLRAEAEESKRKKIELEEQLKVAQQQTPPLISFPAERRVALVIGNAAYKFNPLKNPINDSTDMAKSLRSVGFEVIEANNSTLVQMREATRRFADKLSNSDVGLVYYSGHGVEVKGKNFLIPVNADIKREYEVVDQAFDASQFLEMMDNIRGPNNKRVNILIVDACRNNELQKSWRSTNNGLARMDAPGGTFISFATAPGRVAADGAGRNSPYTKHLLQALKQPNVPIEQVFKVVRRNVMEETKGEQIPWENSSLVGDFYFTVK